MKKTAAQPGLRRKTLLPLLTLFGCLVSGAAAQASCKINGVSDVDFGDYDVFALGANTDGVGNLTIRCTGGSSAAIALSRGLSNNFAPRTLRYGSRVINYNLYTSAARNVVWGDGTGGTSKMYITKNQTGDLDVFGSIPAGQDAAVGSYVDTIIVSIDF